MSLVPETVSNTVVKALAFTSSSVRENPFLREIAGCIFENHILFPCLLVSSVAGERYASFILVSVQVTCFYFPKSSGTSSSSLVFW